MQKIIALSFVVVLAALSGCGTPCEAAADKQQAKIDTCGAAEAPAEGEGEGEGEGEAAAPKCDEADATLAECNAACYEAADCKGIPGTKDFDVAGTESTDFTACTTKCSE